MGDLTSQLRDALIGRVAVVGVGNCDWGDDGAGTRLAAALLAAGCPDVYVSGTTPERVCFHLPEQGFDTVLFLDATEFGGSPGSVVLLDAAGIQSRHPQVSTHKISLGTLAAAMENARAVKVWLLGIQPGSIKLGGLTGPVSDTVDLLSELLSELLQRRVEKTPL